MDKFLNWLLGWIGIALIAFLGLALSLLLGLILHSLATAFCPEADVVSGICTAPWFPWVERGITLTVAALAGALAVFFAAAAAERTQRRLAAYIALAFSMVIALMIASLGGPSGGSLLLEALMMVSCGVLALYRVHLQLDPARQKARYEVRKKARKKTRKKARKHALGKSRGKTSAVSHNHHGGRRQSLRQRLALGSPSPAIGNAATASMVLLGLWCIFMILMLIAHSPASLETEVLLDFEEMYFWWWLAALLTMLLLVAEIANRAADAQGRNLRQLASNLFALILVTLMMATNGQFAMLYSRHHWDREHAYVPRHSIHGDFSLPSAMATGSTANEEWLEFQEWLDSYVERASTVRLDFQPEQPVRHLAQCTPDLWRAQCEEIRFRVGDGAEHVLRRPYGGRLREVLMIPEDGSLEAAVLLFGLEAGPFRDQVSAEDIAGSFLREGPLETEALNRRIQDSDRYFPLHVLVPSDATVQWLDSLLLRLEERGADSFVLIFHD